MGRLNLKDNIYECEGNMEDLWYNEQMKLKFGDHVLVKLSLNNL